MNKTSTKLDNITMSTKLQITQNEQLDQQNKNGMNKADFTNKPNEQQQQQKGFTSTQKFLDLPKTDIEIRSLKKSVVKLFTLDKEFELSAEKQIVAKNASNRLGIQSIQKSGLETPADKGKKSIEDIIEKTATKDSDTKDYKIPTSGFLGRSGERRSITNNDDVIDQTPARSLIARPTKTPPNTRMTSIEYTSTKKIPQPNNILDDGKRFSETSKQIDIAHMEDQQRNSPVPEKNEEDLEELVDEEFELLDDSDPQKQDKNQSIKESMELTQTTKVFTEAHKWDLKQDLALIDFAKGKNNAMTRGLWDLALQQKKIPECNFRTGEALRTRYKFFLQNLTDDEIKKMKTYYEENGNGIVLYKNIVVDDGDKKKIEKHINTITNLQPDHQTKIVVPRYTGKVIKDTKPIINQQANDEELGFEEDQQEKKTINRKRKENPMIDTKIFADFKKLKPIDDIWHHGHLVTDIFSSHSKPKEYQISSTDKKLTVLVDFEKKSRMTVVRTVEEDEATKVMMEKEKLLKLAKTYHMTYANIKELFYRVSGNYDNLKEVLDNGDEKLIWLPEDDEDLLHSLKNPRLMKYLIATKGQENLEERKNFLEIVGFLNKE